MPVATLRIKIISENATMVMMALVRPRPTTGIKNARNARVGMVYKNPEMVITVAYSRTRRAATMPMTSDSANAIVSAVRAMAMCSPNACATSAQLRRNHVMPETPCLQSGLA